jgi:hypothetical protein
VRRGEKLPGALEQFDDSDGSKRRHRPLLSRPSILGLTIVSACVALLACRALWRSNAPLPSLPAAAPPPSVSPAPSAAPAAVVVREAPTGENAVVADPAPTAAAPPASDARERCKQSIRNRRNRDILAFCPAAFAEDAGDADVAVAIFSCNCTLIDLYSKLAGERILHHGIELVRTLTQ